jgi:tetratricopeptide (TPR) repeat protein
MMENTLADALRSGWIESKSENVKKAIAAYEAVLTVYSKQAYPYNWAETQYRIGLAWCDLPDAAKAGNLKKAILAYKEALSVRPTELLSELRRDIETNLCWAQLLTKDFVGALSTSERAPSEDTGYLSLQAKRAHALLFLGRSEGARQIYGKYVGQQLPETGKSWERGILADFDELEKNGLKSPEFAKIREMLKSK